MAELTIIAAVDEGGLIGKGGALPWRLPEDLKHFKRQTTGHAVIMGRKTWEEVQQTLGRPLPRRRNIVVTRRHAYDAPGAELSSSVEGAVELARTTDSRPFVIGGATIYEQALPLATHMVLTEVPGHHEGDTWFPEWDRSRWREVERVPSESCSFVWYERVR